MPTDDVVLSEEQRVELSGIVQSRSLSAGYVFRARLILMLAEGVSFNTIKRQMRTTAPPISRWKTRFLESGLDRLDTHHLGQSASVLRRPCEPGFCRLRARSRRMDRHTGVAASWLRSWVSSKTRCKRQG
jgi:hypothetical protein